MNIPPKSSPGYRPGEQDQIADYLSQHGARRIVLSAESPNETPIKKLRSYRNGQARAVEAMARNARERRIAR